MSLWDARDKSSDSMMRSIPQPYPGPGDAATTPLQNSVVNRPEPQSTMEANQHFLEDLNEIQRKDSESLHFIFLGTVPVFCFYFILIFLRTVQ